MEWAFCTPRVAVGGGVSTPEKIEAMADEGITHIISCRREQEAALAEHPGMMMLWNPIDDDGQPKPIDWFDKSLTFAMSALAMPYTKVYCHCFHGSNRSASTALAVLMAWGYDFDEALALVLKARPNAEIRYREDARKAVQILGYC